MLELYCKCSQPAEWNVWYKDCSLAPVTRGFNIAYNSVCHQCLHTEIDAWRGTKNPVQHIDPIKQDPCEMPGIQL